MAGDPWTEVATGEEAAVYAYGVLIPSLGDADRNVAVTASTGHSRARDRARAALAQSDKNPQMPVAFDIPFAVTDANSARRLAVLCETRLVNVYCTLAPQVEGEARQYFTESAQECSARAVHWGQRPQAFPGSGGSDATALPGPSGGSSGAPAPDSASPALSVPATPAPASTAPTGDGAAVQ